MATAQSQRLTDQFIDEIVDRIAHNRQVRRTLPPGGRIHIDRQLPFLFVYRPLGNVVDPAVAGLITSEASYLIAPARARTQAWTSRLVDRVAGTLSAVFGGFLALEVWAAAELPGSPPSASFRVVAAEDWTDSPTVERVASSLADMRLMKRRPEVVVEPGGRLSPPGLRSLLPPQRARELSTRYVGLEVPPIFRDAATGEEFPFLQRSMARQMDTVFRRTAFEFARSETAHRPLHYQSLGRRTFVRAVKEADLALSKVAESFDLLMTVTPVNADAAFRSFQRSKYTKPPRFRYRPRTVDPTLLKRAIYNAKLERVEDPTLEYVLREKQRELELKLTMIGERERPRFLPTSIALYGNIDPQLVEQADSLTRLLTGTGGGNHGRKVDAATFAGLAESEFERFRSVHPEMAGRVILRDDMVSLMVSAGDLLVGSGMSFPARRVEPLIQHEAGTHVVTYWNGRAQPFRLLASGLAHHDELQEGLAVFAEYLVGGLTPARLKTLAGRVLAARAVTDGAAFMDTFRMLRDDKGFSARAAYLISMRVHRGGGFTKDAVYLRGLQKVIEYLEAGGRLETLFVGKMATEHAPIIEELLRRKVLIPPPLRPSYMDLPDTHYRIERVRRGLTLQDLTDH